MYNARTIKRESFKPQVVEWTEDQSNRMLWIHLPGFKSKEIRYGTRTAGKLFIRGSRLAHDQDPWFEDKYIDVEQYFDVPEDVIIDKRSATFNPKDGFLVVILPKRAITEAEAVTKEKTIMNEATKEEESKQEEEKQEATKEEESKQEEEKQEATKEEESKQEATKEEESKQEEEKQGQGKIGIDKKDENISKEETTSNEAMQNEPNQKEKSTTTETIASIAKETESRITNAMHNEPSLEKEKETVGTDTIQDELNSKPKAQEMPQNDNSSNNKDKDVENLKTKTDEGIIHQAEKKVKQTIEEMKENDNDMVKAISSEVKSNKEKIGEVKLKLKLKLSEIYRDTPEKIRKKINNMRQGEDGWLNSKYVDGAVEKVNRNTNIIAGAVMGFCVGLYVSQKLKARGG